MRQALMELCNTINNIISSGKINVTKDHKQEIHHYIDDVMLWYYSHDQPTKMDYREKIDDLNKVCDNIVNTYKNEGLDLFNPGLIDNNLDLDSDKLEKLCLMLLTMIQCNQIPGSRAMITLLKNKLHGVVKFIFTHDTLNDTEKVQAVTQNTHTNTLIPHTNTLIPHTNTLTNTLIPHTNTLIPQTYIINQHSETKDPVNVTIDPMDVTIDQMNVTIDPMNVTIDLMNVTIDPMNVTKDPMNVTKDPLTETIAQVSEDEEFQKKCRDYIKEVNDMCDKLYNNLRGININKSPIICPKITEPTLQVVTDQFEPNKHASNDTQIHGMTLMELMRIKQNEEIEDMINKELEESSNNSCTNISNDQDKRTIFMS